MKTPVDPPPDRPHADETGEPKPASEAPSLRKRFDAFWLRHRTLFWTVHSVWALATGVLVVYFARERYGFVPWVVLFLVLTWASTLFFSRRVRVVGQRPGLVEETTSYLTRTMYQETLFFLLPFYAYSTVLGSPNMVFTGLLLVLAVTSCFDLLFDRWLRTSPVASLLFFGVVTFAAMNLLLPILFPIAPVEALRWSAGIAVVGALPLALQGRTARRRAPWVIISSVVFLGTAIGVPQLVPPVPLRMDRATFAGAIDPEDLSVSDTLGSVADVARLGDGLFVLVEVFAPSVTPTGISVEWRRDGDVLRESRPITITAHESGFRVWEALRPESGLLPPGRYQIILRTAAGRVFGQASIRLSS